MNPIIVAIIVFTCTFGGALLGMRLRTILPGHHFDDQSKDTVKVGIGLIATMTALVLAPSLRLPRLPLMLRTQQ